MRKMNDKVLLDAGYKKYSAPSIWEDFVEVIFQKRFDDEIGKKYFIDVKKCTSSYYDEPHYEVETQLYQKDTHNAMNIVWLHGWKSIEEIENWMDKFWNNEEYDYYERWDEC